MTGYLYVFIGAGLGGMARHAVNMAAQRFPAAIAFPYGTLAINVLGSLLMGVVVAWFVTKGEPAPSMRLFLATGILGGFTTFSAFSLECVLLLQKGEIWPALLYIALSVLLSVAALSAAWWITVRLLLT